MEIPTDKDVDAGVYPIVDALGKNISLRRWSRRLGVSAENLCYNIDLSNFRST